MSKVQIARAALVALLIVSSPAAGAESGWVVVEKSGSTTLIWNGMMRTTWPGGFIILSAERGELTFVDDARRIYARGPVTEYCGTLGKLFDEAMQNTPPEQRDLVRKMLGRQDWDQQHRVTVVAGKEEQLAGLNTLRYRVSVDDSLYQEVWVTQDHELMKALHGLGRLSGKLVACTKTTHPENSPEMAAQYLELMDEGLPLKMVSHAQGTATTTLEITSVDRKELGGGEFKVPDGYKRLPLADILRAQMGLPAEGGQ